VSNTSTMDSPEAKRFGVLVSVVHRRPRGGAKLGGGRKVWTASAGSAFIAVSRFPLQVDKRRFRSGVNGVFKALESTTGLNVAEEDGELVLVEDQ
jgi:hypothetical protein